MTLVKQTCKVDVNCVPCSGVIKDVFSMSISQSNHTANHGPHARRLAVCSTGLEPLIGLWEVVEEPAVEQRREFWQHPVPVDGDLAFAGLLAPSVNLSDLADLRLHAVSPVEVVANPTEGGDVADPLNHAALLVQGKHSKRADIELATAALLIPLQQTIDHCVELHHAGVLPQIIFWLAQERMLVPRLRQNDNLLGLLKRWHNFNIPFNAVDGLQL
mmetsp:Transcript_100262/g.173219  ORF Transcript_100262/g.173219 Transcript_100262/m.173219 type:complete len:216 (+) Transcript_100262:498-1145(+)